MLHVSIQEIQSVSRDTSKLSKEEKREVCKAVLFCMCMSDVPGPSHDF